MNLKQAVLIALATFVLGCGGGGGGGGSTSNLTITGTVEDVSTGGPPNPAAQVQAGTTGAIAQTDASGFFTLTAAPNTTELRVDRKDGSALFLFPLLNVSGTTVDAGILWIGPMRVAVTGTVIDGATGLAISGANVDLGGIVGKTDASGNFNLAGVPYSNLSTSYFPSLPGSIDATGYISVQFTPEQAADVSGTVNVGTFQMVSSSGSNPPGSPYNIWGRVLPASASPGTTVTLTANGAPVRTTSVGSDGSYYFWVSPGTYTISFVKTGYTSPSQQVTLTQPNQVVEKDATLTASP